MAKTIKRFTYAVKDKYDNMVTHGRTKNYDKLFRRLGNTVYLVTD